MKSSMFFKKLVVCAKKNSQIKHSLRKTEGSQPEWKLCVCVCVYACECEQSTCVCTSCESGGEWVSLGKKQWARYFQGASTGADTHRCLRLLEHEPAGDTSPLIFSATSSLHTQVFSSRGCWDKGQEGDTATPWKTSSLPDVLPVPLSLRLIWSPLQVRLTVY